MGKIKTAKDKRLAAMVRGESKRYPHHLQEVPKEAWPIRMRYAEQAPAKVMRSRKFLVQICPELDGFTRLSICRAEYEGARWPDGISWDDLQRLKAEAGYADRDAVEVYPSEEDVVNVANMRHLWVLPDGQELGFKWSK